jgi:predicted small lipoprotein YifL
MRFVFFCLLIFGLILPGCGKKGPPRPPADHQSVSVPSDHRSIA